MWRWTGLWLARNYSFSKTRDTLSIQNLTIPGFPWIDLIVSKLSVDAGSLLNTVKQVSRTQVILKTQPPICLDYRGQNRPQFKLNLLTYHVRKNNPRWQFFIFELICNKIPFVWVVNNFFFSISFKFPQFLKKHHNKRGCKPWYWKFEIMC